MTHEERIRDLEKQIAKLKSKIENLSEHVEEKTIIPYSKGGASRNQSRIRPIDIKTGFCGTYGGSMIWNDIERDLPPYGESPSGIPEEGYSRHSHSRYEGGALDISALELVEYTTGHGYNKYCHQYWPVTEQELENLIAKDENGNPKVGLLQIEWDSTEQIWKAGGLTVIDVDTTKFVQYKWTDKDGAEVPPYTFGASKTSTVKTDDNGNPMIGYLKRYDESYSSEHNNKANIVWDKDAQCFRFYSVFKPYPED
ncbi:MAG: hypothetical protein DRJ45_05460 [Thermoprotei archaeon]|nr:MAG: hypothetical protein DRJ45_05460 [Thermoprotei archaeon]